MNDLTEKLLAEGYTKENHPDNVKWDDNWDEFKYTNEYNRSVILESPCGLLKKGGLLYGYMSYMGINWRLENDNPTFPCPYKKADCKLNHKFLRHEFGAGLKWVHCAFKMSDKPYDYEKSIEKINDDYEKMKENKRKEIFSKLKWNRWSRHCNCIKWDSEKGEWRAKFDPAECVRGCNNDICVLTGKSLKNKRGNVFYDLRISKDRKDGTFWNGEPIITMTKGKKFFEKQLPFWLCESYIKCCKKEIQEYADMKYSTNKHFDKSFKAEALKVRVEVRAKKDLMQDLQDVNDGIKVFHESDLVKEAKQEKKESREKRNAPKQKVKKLVKRWGKEKLKDVVMLNKEGYCPEEIAEEVEMLNKYYIEKILKIEELEELLKDSEPPEKKYEQVSLF